MQQITVLLTVGCVRHLLPGLDEDAAIAAVNQHRLAPAFDIGLGSRRLVRVLPSAVAAFNQGQSRRRLLETEVFAEVLHGHTDPARISGEQARLMFNCAGGTSTRWWTPVSWTSYAVRTVVSARAAATRSPSPASKTF